MEELERILATEEVEPNEDGGGRTKPERLHAGESGRVAQLAPVAEHRGRAQKGKRLGRQAREAEPDHASNALPSDFQQMRDVLGGRGRSLPCNRVEHRADEERNPAGRRFEGGPKASSGSRPCSSRASRTIEARPSGPGRIAAASGSVISSATSAGSRPSPPAAGWGPRREEGLPRACASGRAASAARACPPSARHRSQAASAGETPRWPRPIQGVENRERALRGRLVEEASCGAPNSGATSAAGPRAAAHGSPEPRTPATARRADGRSRTQTRPRAPPRRRAHAYPPSRRSRAPQRASGFADTGTALDDGKRPAPLRAASASASSAASWASRSRSKVVRSEARTRADAITTNP